jgi:hypothetical protein
MKRLAACILAFVAATSRAYAQTTPTPPPVPDLANQLMMTLVWALVATILFIFAFKMVDWATPGDLKQQLADGNTAMAVFVAGLCIASAIIISALVG